MSAEQAIGVLNGTMSVMATMKAAGRLPVLNARRQTAGKDELFVLAMLGAAQQAERARPIEAAIALLNTCHVTAVTVAARSLASRLKEAGLTLMPISEGVFNCVAGYPRVTESSAADIRDPETPAVKPSLTLLKSA